MGAETNLNTINFLRCERAIIMEKMTPEQYLAWSYDKKLLEGFSFTCCWTNPT